MPVKINVDSRFWGGIEGKTRVFEVQGKTVGECLRQLVEKGPSLKTAVLDESGDLTAVCFLTVNLAPLMVGRLEKEVKDGDVIGLVFGGGS